MLDAGAQIGPYKFLSPLGQGGMGEVYRAADARLSREVAIKVLPAEFAKDADRLKRFEQEARATSALNHPNILTIHDIGAAPAENGGAPYIVAELLDGEELRAQLNGSPISQRKAVDYARQIADGLAAAHAKGIVHRDLKPENLFVTTDGRVKILDFGLAKLRPQPAMDAGSEVQTQMKITDPGTVMGTVGYMSPEQVRGQDVDHRSDIFAFGVILYEMLSGRRTFTGDSAIELMNAILKEEPPELGETNAKISPALDKIVRRCLEKKPERRFQSASDLGFALEALTIPSGANQTQTLKALPEAAVDKAGRFSRIRLWQAACLLSVIAAIALAWLYLSQPAPATQVTRFSINLPKETRSVYPTPALSPDGRRLAFAVRDAAGKSQLWLRPLDAFAAQPLPGTEGALYTIWSPESKSIAFFADGKLKKLNPDSGVIETICACDGTTGDWNRDGVILFSNRDRSLSRVSASGGKPEVITSPDVKRGESAYNHPSFLPDGRRYLFQVFGGDQPGIYAGSLDAPEHKLILPLSADTANSTKAVWSPPGHLVYALNRSTLLAQAFDSERLELKGDPFRLAENVIVIGPGYAGFTLSANGVLAFIAGGEADTIQLTWTERGGKRLNAIGPADRWGAIRLSPDESLAALMRDEPDQLFSLWMLDLAQGATRRFVAEGANFNPVWSPDGRQLAFSSARNSAPNLFLKPLAGSVAEERLLASQFQSNLTSWSPDGRFLVYSMVVPQNGRDLWLLPLSGERKPQPLFQTKANEFNGCVSPDGQWLAYVSNETGSNEVYVTQFPQPARSWRISRNGGVNPFWRGDGKELYFAAGNKLMAVSVMLSAEVQSGAPQPLFDLEGTEYAPSKDGQRFLVPVVTEKAPPPPINVVLNWTAEVKK
ncbi:MAG: protein kinase [Acidobacteriota bacterium]|nr:MAG: protein kinase [Acidobacteriota bacterium]